MNKKSLEILLQGCVTYREPRLILEQYPTPAGLAAEIVYHAYLRGDVKGKKVFDLGCGPGIFAIGCALMGAEDVKGFDVDGNALALARSNAAKLKLAKAAFIQTDVKDIRGDCDTVFQNPPFGVRRQGADRKFLKKALEVGKVVYTIHKAETGGFVRKYIKDLGGIVTDVTQRDMVLPHLHEFHRKERKRVKVYVYRVEKE
jgi:putative methylase